MRLAVVSCVKSASAIPWSSARSATMSQVPPEMVSTASPPLIGPVWTNVSAVARRSSSDVTRMAPAACRNASMTASSPTNAPVWACAVRAAVSLLPTLSTTTGLPTARALRQAARKSRWMASANTAITRVSGSSAR